MLGNTPKEPQILLYDIESSPNTIMAWEVYETNALKVIEPRQMISFSWKWAHEKTAHVLALPDFPGYKNNPKDNSALVRALYDLMCKADLVVGHNVIDFDDKMVNTDFVRLKLPPPPPHKQVDTLRVARSRFRFNYNNLGKLGEFLGLGSKVKHWGFELWEKCLEGDKKAWDLMRRYNRGDVILLEKVYLKLRPWMTNHPNMNALDSHAGCIYCRSQHYKRGGYQLKGGSKVARFRCLDCGKWFSGVEIWKRVGKKKICVGWKFS